MPEYAIGKHRTRIKQRRTAVVHVSITRPVYDRLVQMKEALQREVGPDVNISVATIVRRILYGHASLRKLAHRHYSPEPETLSDIEL